MDFLEEKNRKANEKKKSPSNKSGTDQMMLKEDKEEDSVCVGVWLDGIDAPAGSYRLLTTVTGEPV